MKEATGEASMTGLTIAIIAVVAAIAVPIITVAVNALRNNSCCSANGGVWYSGACYMPDQCATDTATNKTTCSGDSFSLAGKCG